MLSRNGKVDSDGNYDWVDAIVDAAIMGAMTFFTTLGGLGATGLIGDPKTSMLAAGIAAGTQFFAILAMKRGLRKEAEEKPD
jgi:hypothetical protein